MTSVSGMSGCQNHKTEIMLDGEDTSEDSEIQEESKENPQMTENPIETKLSAGPKVSEVPEDTEATTKKSLEKFEDPIKVMKIIFNEMHSEDKLKLIAYERYLRSLLRAVQQEDFEKVADNADIELKMLVQNPLFGKLPIKLKFMFYGGAYFPYPYRVARKIYDMISGKNRKYSID